MEIDIKIVKELIRNQFPQWKNCDIRPVEKSGHDNRTFHLGKDMLIRMPSRKEYEPQIEKEARWLAYLAQHLSLPITRAIAKGNPDVSYPYVWSINKWLDGETVTDENVDKGQFALDLAEFLRELQAIDASEGPLAGRHNFYRGGDLAVYHEETVEAIGLLKGKIDDRKCLAIWENALSSQWDKEAVWIHGDLAEGNLLVKDGRLAGVIDFGMLGIGDPACDLVMAWTYFDQESRAVFKQAVDLDEETWNRAQGWALWKALITYDDPTSKKVIASLDVCEKSDNRLDKK